LESAFWMRYRSNPRIGSLGHGDAKVLDHEAPAIELRRDNSFELGPDSVPPRIR